MSVYDQYTNSLQQMSGKSQSWNWTCDMLEAFPPPPPPPSSFLVTKPSSCSQGELLPKKDNCSSYFLCDYNYELQEKQCEIGKVFSPTRKQCVQKYGLQDDCSQVFKPSPCNPGEFLPKKENCSSYFLCGYDSELQEKQCQIGKVFSPTRKQCVPKHGLQDDCSQVSTISLCEPGKKYSDANNCNLYYLCRFGVRVRRICPSGQHYSVGLESCVIAYSNYDDCIIS
ncbi:hypothetical protein CHS0354_022423 [Potamilus streckersoni]|uniref:Chitin-binding type-2 domain-containing protein n=1 Tax=Potamilus streckersoni TaxID=2493646 RepID=A0AAE0W382_9BIVA|nr:hypothetical protein CHS0354_022423 [Potamilus streckersoni]